MSEPMEPTDVVEEIEVQPVHGPEQADPEEFEEGDDEPEAGQS